MPPEVADRSKFEGYRRIKDCVLDATVEVDAAIVDGVHDRMTLRHLGFSKPVYTRSKYSYRELADRLAKKYSTVIVLTDFDAEGTLANELISRLLEKRNVRVCRACRDAVAAALKKVNVSTIEGIYRLIV
jgi:5S rRNA maturation endonuclease (ribonuclease M5)